MTIRYALIGSGMMGQEHLRNMRLIEDIEVALIADPNPEMRNAAQAIAGSGVETLSDPAEALARTDIDAFVVATPNHLHAAMLEPLLDTGRPILMEKPAIISMDEAVRLRDRIEAASAPLWVAMEYRYTPGVDQLVAATRNGDIGQLKMFSLSEKRFPFLPKVGNWNRFNRYTGGTLVEKCCHYFDLMRLAIGSEPVEISAIGGQALNHLDERIDGEVPDVLDHAYVSIRFENDVKAMLELCMFAEGAIHQERVLAIGTDGLIEVRVPGPGRFEGDGKQRPTEIGRARRFEKEKVDVIEVDPVLAAAGDHHGATFHQHSRFAEMIRSGGQPDVTFADGVAAVAMGIAAQDSIRLGRPISLAPTPKASMCETA